MNPLAQTAPRQAYFPGDPKWDDVRRAWNLAVDQQPAAVFVPESADDVAEAVNFARRNGLRVALQGTGHGAAPLGSLEDTVLVKTHLMQEIEIDCARRRARAGAGVIWEQVVEPATALRPDRAPRLLARRRRRRLLRSAAASAGWRAATASPPTPSPRSSSSPPTASTSAPTPTTSPTSSGASAAAAGTSAP